MHYFIDGYNLLFRMRHTIEELQLSREALIQDLNLKSSALHLPITIVFDAHYQEGDLTISHYHDIEVIYSSKGQSADDLLIKLLKLEEHPKECTLVTNDNKLAWRGKILRVSTMKVKPFLEYINRRYKNLAKKQEDPEKKLELLPTIPKQPSTPLKKEQPSDYEKIFTEKYQELEKKVPQKKKKKTMPQKKYRSDYERWLEIFEGKDRGSGA